MKKFDLYFIKVINNLGKKSLHLTVILKKSFKKK